MSDTKMCAICGDTAWGYNFGALTCESCRTFYRRNATRAQEFVCLFNDQCVVNCMTRKHCKKCRIEKCLAIGMKRATFAFGRDHQMKSNHRNHSTDSATDLVNVNSIDVNHNIVPHIPSLIRELIFSFNELEMHRLKQLFSSTTHIRDTETNKMTTKAETNIDFIKALIIRSDIKCRGIIKMCKGMDEFKELCEDDKIILLKASCPEITCLLSVLTFDFDGEFWTVATDSENAIILPLDMLKYGTQKLYDSYKKFMYTVKVEYESDTNLIDLLMAIILFNPNRPNLRQRDIVKLQQKTYMYLLQRYLEIKHNSKSGSETRFLRLMNCLNKLHATNMICVQNYADSTYNNLSPLMREIYEIKYQANLCDLV